jgi:hypothetical protein
MKIDPTLDRYMVMEWGFTPDVISDNVKTKKLLEQSQFDKFIMRAATSSLQRKIDGDDYPELDRYKGCTVNAERMTPPELKNGVFYTFIILRVYQPGEMEEA